jgi:hypothetical protein
MSFVITAAERASFRRCRRQWDFGAGNRQDLEPLQRPAVPDLDRAVRDALAVYYFPGMWDWDPGVRLPLVVQQLERPWTGSGSGAVTGPAAGTGGTGSMRAGPCRPAISGGRQARTGSPRCWSRRTST